MTTSTTPPPAPRDGLAHEVRHALDALPATLRTVVVLGDVHGLTYGEIANSLGVRPSTVRRRIHRGRRRLGRALGDRAASSGTTTGDPT